MGIVETLTSRNADFAQTQYTEGLRMMPAMKTIVIGCVDPRVDPAAVLGARQGEIAVIRNVAGRVTPRTLEELVMLRKVSQAAGGDLGPGWELIVLQHTNCGITLIEDDQQLLAPYFETDETGLAEQAVGDPRTAIAHDVAALRGESRLQGARVSGLLYDVTTGSVDVVVPPTA
ncbi:carbonic anhydrase [Streptomyces bauhiniae]|uniref:carbonic anhydrase n=1 Tax=Streptomyces bauhiniae TaxID=2340725 RepID=A0A7K3QS93_9ACTN|nr:carbonic anhydrase [Streptomyces bauhiniae]NEB92777.1 carbonic anhydrase [Streptomyces bauhiniae]